MNNFEIYSFIKKTDRPDDENSGKLQQLINRYIVSINIPQGTSRIGAHSFRNCASLTDVKIPDSVSAINSYAFAACSKLMNINIPNSVTEIGDSVFLNCTALENVTVENGFNGIGLNLSASTKFSVETLVNIINALADRTGQTAYTLTFGSANLDKLSDEQKIVATEKNWTLA